MFEAGVDALLEAQFRFRQAEVTSGLLLNQSLKTPELGARPRRGLLRPSDACRYRDDLRAKASARPVDKTRRGALMAKKKRFSRGSGFRLSCRVRRKPQIKKTTAESLLSHPFVTHHCYSLQPGQHSLPPHSGSLEKHFIKMRRGQSRLS
jgi:hypothetical protein